MKKLLLILSLVLFVFACNKNKQEVYIYNWTEYMPDSVLAKFEAETGIKVIYATYDSNELMYSKLKLQTGSGYDVIVPSTYYVHKMAREGLLLELDHAKLPNLSNIQSYLLDQDYDKGNQYSVPYLWGASIIGYNAKNIDGANISSWGDLWNEDYAGKVLLQNDMREVFQMALMLLGYNGNSTDEKEIAAAYDKLKTLVPNVRVFNSDSPKQPFINEEVNIGLLWTGEAYRAGQANKDISYVFPKEGAILWVDCLSIPNGAKNVENAYKLINFLMRPDIALEISQSVGYATPNSASLEMMSEDMRNNRLLNPSKEDMENAQYQLDVSDAILIYEKYWERLKAGE